MLRRFYKRPPGLPTGLSAEQRIAVLLQAVQDGLLLEQALAAPALLLALKELPPVMHQHAEQGQAAAGHATVTFFAAAGPASTAAGAVAAPTNGTAPQAQQAQQQQQVELVPRQPTPAAAAAPASGIGDSGGTLRAAVLTSVGQLAGCVGEAGPLLEVIASTVSRLVGPQGASTATLECCIAAAEALQGMPEEVGRQQGGSKGKEIGARREGGGCCGRVWLAWLRRRGIVAGGTVCQHPCFWSTAWPAVSSVHVFCTCTVRGAQGGAQEAEALLLSAGMFAKALLQLLACPPPWLSCPTCPPRLPAWRAGAGAGRAHVPAAAAAGADDGDGDLGPAAAPAGAPPAAAAAAGGG
jgi:hypothetical protein